MSNQLSCVGLNYWISAVTHHVKEIILCWTKFIDISCQSSCQTNYLVLDQINGYQLSLIMSNQLSYVGPNSWISAVSHHVKPILCWTKLMDISCHSSCQTNYLMLNQINGYQLSVITSNELSYVGPNSRISAVSHRVKPIILCWTKLMDISCHSSCQRNCLMLDQIHGYQLSVIMSNQLSCGGPN